MVAADTQVFEPAVDYGLAVRWRAPLGSGYSSVSVAHGLAVTMFSDGESDVVIAFDADTGDEAWRYSVAPTYFGHDGSQTGPISTPYVGPDLVYALGPRGNLVAVSTAVGDEVWARHLVTDYGAGEPVYGFSTSPLVVGEVLLVQIGAGDGKAVAGFNRHSGELLWQAGTGAVDYQSPALMSIGGETQLVYSTKEWIGGIRPATGETLWEHAHGGDGSATGSGGLNPLAVGPDRLFLTHKGSASALLTLYDDAGGVAPGIQWETRAIRSSYGVPVYNSRYLYSYSRTLLTCVSVETGDPVWKSRPPGDGFPIVVDGRLVIATQKGGLHVAEASPDGYSEIAGLALFDDLVWSPPTFANGSVYVRSLGEIARVDVAPASGPAAVASTDPVLRGFAAFLARVSVAEDKHAEIDAFLAGQGDLPIIEVGGEGSGEHTANVWFVYRGAAEQDVAITGDFLGNRRAETMERVAGTDLYYYAAHVEPGARLNYRFVVDFDTTVLDPLNPRSVPKTMSIYNDGGGAASWFAMPGWRVADHLSPVEVGAAGRVEQVEIPAGAGPSRTVDVYLPRGYDAADAAYPVAYVHWGQDTLAEGMVAASLDNLIGHSVEPLIAVFVHRAAGGFGELIWDGRREYVRAVAEDIVPIIEGRYRVRPGRDARASVGYGFGGLAALDLAFTYPDLFGKVAAQSPMRLTAQEDELRERVTDAERHPFRLWLGWGVYDTRSTLEGWSTVTWNVALRDFFEARGYDVAGGQVDQGGGWESWRQRNDEVFQTLFPSASAASDDR
jgi:enterochelin esterase-like enzyme/outer membrane protein assembly factor BamB